MIEPYHIVCMQVKTNVVHGHDELKAKQIIRDNLKHDLDLIDDCFGWLE